MSNSIAAVEGNFKNALVVQKKLEFLNRHSSCIVKDLQDQIKEKNKTIVKLKAVQLKDPVIIQQTKVEECTPERNQLVSLLKEQLEHKTSEIEKTMRLLETAETSTRELSEVFLAERTECTEKISHLDEKAFKLEVQVKLVQAALSEKEKENASLSHDLQCSEDKVQELTSELEILKDMISRETADVGTETVSCVRDVACQNDAPTPLRNDSAEMGVGENRPNKLVDRSMSCCVTSDDKECQTEILSPRVKVESPTVDSPTADPPSPVFSPIATKRPPPVSPTADENSSSKRIKSELLSIENEEISPCPLPLNRRLKMPSPIPIKLEEESPMAMIADSDIEDYSPEKTQYNFNPTTYSQQLPSIPEEEWLTVANPDTNYSHTHDGGEPKTPEHLINTENNRSRGYRNDPDYSSVDSSDQSPEEVAPAEGAEVVTPITLIKESPQMGDMISPDIDQYDSGFLDTASRTPEQRLPRGVVTVSVDSSPSPEREEVSNKVKHEVRESVSRIIKKAFRRVNKTLEPTDKLNLYKASLSKSPNPSRAIPSSRFKIQIFIITLYHRFNSRNIIDTLTYLLVGWSCKFVLTRDSV